MGLLLAAALLLPAGLAGMLPARGDLPDFFWPMKAYTAERWGAGEIPLWNPLSGAGEPWLAQLQSGALYPVDLPFLLGEERGAFLAIALHLALAAAGAAFWTWDLGASRPAALLAGGLYAGGGAFLSLLPVYNNACTAAWIPWVFATARRVAIGRSRGTGLAVAVAGSFLAGEPALAAAATIAALALAACAGAEGEPGQSRERGGSRLRALILPSVTGLLLAGAALAPFAGLLLTSERRERATREEALARAIGESDLADLIAPPSPDSTRTVAPGRGGYLLTLAFGPLPLLLAAGAGAGFPGRPRFLVALGLLALGAALLAFGAPGRIAPVLWDLGLLKGIRFPARWFVFTHLATAVAAGAGLDGLLWGRNGGGDVAGDGSTGDPGRRRTAGGVALVVLGLAAAVAALAILSPAARTSRDGAKAALTVTALLVAGAVAVVARRRVPAARARAGAAITVLALAPLPWIAAEPLAAIPTRSLQAAPPALAGMSRSSETGRVFAPAGQDRALAMAWRHAHDPAWGEGPVSRAAQALAGYTNLRHGIATIGSGSPLGNPRLDAMTGAALQGGDAGRLLALLDVRHVLSPFRPSIPGLRPVGRAGEVGRYDLATAFGRAYFPYQLRIASDEDAVRTLRQPDFDPERLALVAPSPAAGTLPPPRGPGSFAVVRFVSDTAERAELTATASVPSLLVLTRSWDPGWTASVDGAGVPVFRAQVGLLAVVVPAGDHRIEVAYRPLAFRIGLGLSAAGFLGLLLLGLSAPPGARSR